MLGLEHTEGSPICLQHTLSLVFTRRYGMWQVFRYIATSRRRKTVNTALIYAFSFTIVVLKLCIEHFCVFVMQRFTCMTCLPVHLAQYFTMFTTVTVLPVICAFGK